MEAKELVAGYWSWQVRSLDEAIEWLNRAPFGDGAELEIRPIYEAADLGLGNEDAARLTGDRLQATS